MRGFEYRGRTRRAVAVWLAMVLALCAGSAHAPRSSRRDAANAALPAAGLHALRVALDPETGTLGMPAAAAPFEALQAPSAAPRVEALPNGMKILHHDGHFRNYVLAERDTAGRIHTGCADGAARARQAPAPPPSDTPADSVPRDAYGRVVR